MELELQPCLREIRATDHRLAVAMLLGVPLERRWREELLDRHLVPGLLVE